MKLTKEQQRMLKIYAKIASKKKFHPSRQDLRVAGVSRDKYRHHFGTLEAYRDAAKKTFPAVFKNIIDEELFTPKRFSTLKKEAEKYQRFIVTTAVTGCPVHKGFLASIKTFCKRNNAMLLVLTASDPAAVAMQEGVGFIDPVLQDEYIVFDDLSLNEKIFISSIKLSAKHIDPITGLSRIGQRNGSFIYASPKQRLKMTPTSNTKLPHAMMTTGAITVSNYKTERYMSERTAYIADHDHVLGAIIVEIVDNKRYHYRQVQADKQGNFVDLGVLYKRDSVGALPPDSIVLGDWHSGETDESAKEAFVTARNSVVNVTKPKRIVIHDGFNGLSISHHEIKNKILRAQRALKNQLSLQDELTQYAKDLDLLAEHAEEVVIVKSNHDEFLDRYLAEGRYVEDPQNFMVALRLSQAMLNGENPLKHAVEWLGLKNKDKIVWLDRDEDFKVAGVELGAHGDKGANGSKGSLQAMEKAYSNSVSGHAHTPEILRGAYQVGTCSKLKLEYNKGPSSWLLTSCLVYPNGARQLINSIAGKWCLNAASIEPVDEGVEVTDQEET